MNRPNSGTGPADPDRGGLRRRGSDLEDRAVRHLESRGWTILDRNFRDGPRELDIVARRAGIVAFVEVKGRRDTRSGHPFETIGRRKRADIERAARRWLRDRAPGALGGGGGALIFRFDAIALTRENGRWKLEHMPDAWRRIG